MTTLAQLSAVSTGPHLDNRRVAAALIDLVVPAAIAAAAFVAGLSFTRGVLLVAVGWTLYYFFALESGDGQTLGKRLMRLRVVSADGGPASMEQIAKRTVVRILDGHIVGLIVMLATGERRQRLGDIVAGTVVTDADAAPRAEEPTTEALSAPPQALGPARAKPSLSMPSLSMRSIRLPSLSLPSPRRRSAGEPSSAAGAPWYKRSVSMPSLRRRSQPGADDPGSTGAAEPAPARPAPMPEPRIAEPVSRLEEFDPVPSQRPPDQRPEPIEDFMRRDVVIEREPEVEPEAFESYDDEPLARFDRDASVEVEGPPSAEYETVVEYETDVERTVEQEAAPARSGAFEHQEDVVVRPIETVSAIDLVMQDAEQRRPGKR